MMDTKVKDMMARGIRFNDQEIINAVANKVVRAKAIVVDALNNDDSLDHDMIITITRVANNCKLMLDLVGNETNEYNHDIDEIMVDIDYTLDKIKEVKKEK